MGGDREIMGHARGLGVSAGLWGKARVASLVMRGWRHVVDEVYSIALGLGADGFRGPRSGS
jgi:hypothetical protein